MKYIRIIFTCLPFLYNANRQHIISVLYIMFVYVAFQVNALCWNAAVQP